MKFALICAAALSLAACASNPNKTAAQFATVENLASDECRAAMDAALGYKANLGKRMATGLAWGLAGPVGLIPAVYGDHRKNQERKRLNAAVEAACHGR